MRMSVNLCHMGLTAEDTAVMMRLMSLTGPSLKRRITRDTRMSLRVESITRQLRASHASQRALHVS